MWILRNGLQVRELLVNCCGVGRHHDNDDPGPNIRVWIATSAHQCFEQKSNEADQSEESE
jgi:hypothetical protein